mmetsp:Transcript_45835/g.129676  ORF Transcript_45835/g.129676 Transcript_45835/m.129676 type:complete len:204 (+) Transcript_45835:167-778(+)
MLGSISSSFAAITSSAGSMRGVWNAPLVFITFACSAPALSERSLRARIATSVPATLNPFGKSSFVIWQTALFPPSFFRACAQSSWTFGFSRPAIDRAACLPSLAASAIAVPRIFTSSRPCSKVKTPAAQSAVYSPSERPATSWHLSTASGLSFLSLTTPARPAMNISGWQLDVSSSLDSGPFRQSCSTSHPRILWDVLSISWT